MLKFIYGVMGSAKTGHALITEHNYQINGYRTILLKPSVDTRQACIKSRIGLEKECEIFTPTEDLCSKKLFYSEDFDKTIVIVDEAQFCTKAQIDQLRRMAKYINVLCYGLKTDFKTNLFEGSKRLLEVADEIEELPHICKCGNKATINALFINNVLQTSGETIHIGDSEYKPLCYKCYNKLKGSKV